MGKQVTRLGDQTAGHGFPPVPSIKASTNVFAEKKGVVRVGDSYAVHCFNSSCHAGTAATGSRTVFVNGKQVHRVGDKNSCGDTVAQGASTVFAG